MRLVPEQDALLRWLALPFALAGGAVLAAAAWRPELLLRLARCPWRELTGLPCPTCGGTHATVALADGRWQEAWALNPLVPLGLGAVLLWSAWAVAAAFWPRWRVRPRWGPREKRVARWGAAVVLLAVWVRQIVAA